MESSERSAKFFYEELSKGLPNEVKALDFSKYGLKEFVPIIVFALHLYNLSRGIVAYPLNLVFPPSSFRSCDVFEVAISQLFKNVLNYDVVPLGCERPFKDEPEGIVFVTDYQFCFIYECKSRKDGYYRMSSKEEKQHIHRIRAKKTESTILRNVDLKYFLVIAPDFSGDIRLRSRNILKDTNVIPVFVKAEALSFLFMEALGFQPSLRRLIDLQNIFAVTKVEIDLVRSEIQRIRKISRQYST